MGKNTLETALRRQKQWSERANRFKSSLSRWRSLVLILSVFVAILGTVSGVLDPETTLHFMAGILTAIVAAVIPLLAKLRLGPTDVSKWIRSRSASEAIKAEIFQFRSRVGEYSGEDATDNLSAAIEKISRSVEDIPSVAAPEFTVDSEKLKDLSINEYIESRVMSQINDYYRPKANLHAQTADRYRKVHLVLMLFGAVLGAVSAFTKVGMGPWIAVVTTITSSVMAHAAAGRYDELAIGFHATANRLEEITNRWKDKMLDSHPTLEQKTALVAACEEAISSENQSWHAKFSKVKP